jgi:hypothetical protein
MSLAVHVSSAQIFLHSRVVEGTALFVLIIFFEPLFVIQIIQDIHVGVYKNPLRAFSSEFCIA